MKKKIEENNLPTLTTGRVELLMKTGGYNIQNPIPLIWKTPHFTVPILWFHPQPMEPKTMVSGKEFSINGGFGIIYGMYGESALDPVKSPWKHFGGVSSFLWFITHPLRFYAYIYI